MGDQLVLDSGNGTCYRKPGLGCCGGNEISILLFNTRQRLALYRLSTSITAG